MDEYVIDPSYGNLMLLCIDVTNYMHATDPRTAMVSMHCPIFNWDIRELPIAMREQLLLLLYSIVDVHVCFFPIEQKRWIERDICIINALSSFESWSVLMILWQSTSTSRSLWKQRKEDTLQLLKVFT